MVVFNRVLNRFADVDERREVHYDVDFFGVEHFAHEFLVFEIPLIELDALLESRLVSVYEIVEHNGVVSGFD